MDECYVIGRPRGGKLPYTEYLPSASAVYGEDPPRCPECHQFIGLLPWLPPYNVVLEQYSSTHYEDLVLGSGPGDFLVSERMLRWWNDQRLSGMERHYPIKVLRIKGNRGHLPEPRYYVVNLNVTMARFDSIKSNVVRADNSKCNLCEGYDYESIGPVSFVDDSLKGLDVFRCINGYIMGINKNALPMIKKESFILSNATPSSKFYV